ncbi:MAG: RNA-binding protein [Pseudobutyrivibrio sp.]|nr:RNA-binding protein [Pseudobutyrivibrio sp.]
MDLTLAISKAGHDKSQTFVVIKEDETFCYLVNGTTRLVDKPKKKKKIHLQLIKNIPSDVLEEIKEVKTLDDISIKRILKVYNRRNENV